MSYHHFRNDKIDFLRGLAVLTVMILHYHISYHLDQSALNQILAKDFIKAVASNGNYGVTIFFVISGFLITSTSLERYGSLGKIDVISFYIFRFSRIMPCLFLVLSLVILFNFLHIPIFQNSANSTSLALAVFSVLTFWHNVLMEKIGYFNYCLNILWSLSVEEIFYLTFPLFCLSLKKTQLILLFLISLIIIAPIYRSYYQNNEMIALYGYLSCFDAIAIGGAAAIIAQKLQRIQTIQLNSRIRKTLINSAGFFIAGVYLYGGIMENVVFGVSFMAIGTAVFLVSVSNKEFNIVPGLFKHNICWFGKNSYELYLFHIIVLALMKEMFGPDVLNNYTKLLWMMLFFSTSALVANIIATFYSQPMNKKLRHLLIGYGQAKVFSSVFHERTENI